MNKDAFFRELLGAAYDEVLASLRLEEARPEMREELLELIGESVIQRIMYELLLGLDSEQRERYVSLIESGTPSDIASFVGQAMPDARDRIAAWAKDEAETLVASARL